jgi:Icc-related predicted phosphoesterase
MLGRRRNETTLRLFYASDVHGSRLCWKKFINAAAHYPADALVMGGDLTGKALVPIVRQGDGSYSAEVIGEVRVARTAEELDQMQRAISTNGMYPLIVDLDEARALQGDAARRERAFESALLDELRVWVEFADERLAGTERVAYVIPGNDDPWAHMRWCPSGSPTEPRGTLHVSSMRTRYTHASNVSSIGSRIPRRRSSTFTSRHGTAVWTPHTRSMRTCVT